MHAIHSAVPVVLHAALLAALAAAPVPASCQAAPKAAAVAEDGRTAPRYFGLVNATHDGVDAIAIAPAGSGAFQAVDIGGTLRGGVTSITLDVPAGGCLRDIRVGFHDGRTLLYPAIDLCRASGLRLSPRDRSRDEARTGLAADASLRPDPGAPD